MTRSPLAHLPNAVTIARALAGLVGAWLLLQSAGAWTEDAAAALGLASGAVFVLAALSDWLDGWLARRLDAHSALGALLDPIADKVLVGAYFIAFTLIAGGDPWLAIPVAIILGRDVIMTGLRLTRRDRAAPSAPLAVSQDAKFKTALHMALIAAPFVLVIAGFTDVGAWYHVWIGAVWFAALLSLWTAWGYLRALRRPGL